MTNKVQLTQIIRQSMDLLTHRAFREQGHFVKSTGLSMAQYGILMQMHYQRNCGISDISTSMETTTAAASQLVDKLVQSKLVERTEDPHDRRAKQLKLTEKGQELINTGIQARSRWVDEVITVLTPEQVEVVTAGLSILTEAAKRIEMPVKG
jgi:MarR family transcriptional regulator, 2-MHQ and catechol-resistance regulon repressor